MGCDRDQHCDVAEPNFVGNHGSACGFQQFKYKFAGIADRTPNYLTDEEAKLLRDYVEGKASDPSPVLTAKLAEYGYLCKTAKGYEPTVLVLSLGEIRERVKSFDKDALAKLEACAETAAEKLKDLYRALEEIILRDLPKRFLEDEYQRRLVISNCYHMRGYVMAEDKFYKNYSNRKLRRIQPIRRIRCGFDLYRDATERNVCADKGRLSRHLLHRWKQNCRRE